jgi:hypothetical protein
MGKNSKLGLIFKIDVEVFVKKYQLFKKISRIGANPEVFPQPSHHQFIKKEKILILIETIFSVRRLQTS